ncbi:extracellular solute-binding protein [Peterkaempfera sp. SMS 1(5)a]|uniref:extracellular solute-binding protein n=1 Tax=Peterkaempfera podocarpi TaxID=3232308 RepID=UPI00366F8B36
MALAWTVSGCASQSGGSSSADEESGTLTAWIYGDDSVKVQQAAVKEFNKTSGVKVKLVIVPGAEYATKLRAAMASASPPDIFFNWGGGSIKSYVDGNQLVDLTQVVNDDRSLTNAFLASVMAAGGLNGKIYGIPMRGMQPVVLFYNKTLFAANHLKPPTTWSQLQSVSATLRSRNITPFALGGKDTWPELMWLEYLLDRLGGPKVFQKIANGDSSAWGDPAVLKTAQLVRQMVSEGDFGSRFGSVPYNGGVASTLLAKGQAAMQLMGSWEYSTQLSKNPQFAKSGLGWTTFPSVGNGTGNVADVVGNPSNYWSINSGAKHQKAALDFVKSMASQNYAEALVENGDVPTTAIAGVMLTSSPNPDFASFQYVTVQRAPSFTLSWDQALPADQATTMLTEISGLFAGKVSATQFVAAMKALK